MNRDQALAAGKVIVTDAAGNVSISAPPVRDYGRKRRTGKKRKRKPVDPFANTAKRDRPMTTEQSAELAQLARDPLMNFDPRLAAKLTQGQAAQLIPKLRRAARTRANVAQQNQREKRKQPSR